MYSQGGNKASFRNIWLVDADVANNVDLIGASVAGELIAGSIRVGGSLLMHSEATNEAMFKDIYLVGAKVTRNLELNGAHVDGYLAAESVQIGGPLVAYSTKFKGVDLGLSTVNGQVNMPNSVFYGAVTLKHLRVISDVLLGNIECHSRFDGSSTQIDGNLDFSGAKLDAVDLGGASIVGDMGLGDENSKLTWVPPKNGELNLRNAHVGSLSDNQNSWPKRLSLDGFSFGHFGSNSGDSGGEMTGRPAAVVE